MLEILIIIVGSGKVAEMAENKGYSGTLFRILFILGWFFGALMGLLIGGVWSASRGASGPDFCIFFICYLMGGCLAIGAVALLVAVLPEPTRERGYMDDYAEYQRTGRVHDYRRDGDDDGDEDEEERRPRRRARWSGDEDRPRRGGRERDERYREGDDDRPPRRPRREEDY